MTTTGSSSAAPELLEALSWLSEKGGILLLRPEEIHVYRGEIHKCVPRAEATGEAGVLAILEAIKQVRLEHERG